MGIEDAPYLSANYEGNETDDEDNNITIVGTKRDK
jgi:hypothetical protein